MREVIELVTLGIEALAVLVIVGGIVYSIVRYFLRTRLQGSGRYKRFKDRIGNSLLLGLEFLVAADIIRTVVGRGNTGFAGATFIHPYRVLPSR